MSQTKTLWEELLTPPDPAGLLLDDPIEQAKHRLFILAHGQYSWTEWIQRCYDHTRGIYRTTSRMPYLSVTMLEDFGYLLALLLEHDHGRRRQQERSL